MKSQLGRGMKEGKKHCKSSFSLKTYLETGLKGTPGKPKNIPRMGQLF